MQEIKYKAVYGRVYVLFGILFSIIFIAGAIILQNFMIFSYLLASAFLIFIGANILKNPYARFDEKTINLYSFWGNIRYKYTFSSKKELKLIKNNIYLNGKKLKMNAWFLAKNDWKRILHYYELGESSFDDNSLDDPSSL